MIIYGVALLSFCYFTGNLIGDILGIAYCPRASVVHEDVYPTEPIERRLHGALHVVGNGYVAP